MSLVRKKRAGWYCHAYLSEADMAAATTHEARTELVRREQAIALSHGRDHLILHDPSGEVVYSGQYYAAETKWRMNR